MRLIDADELLEHFESCVTNGRPISNLYDLSEIISYVESMHAVEAVEVVHGEWKDEQCGRWIYAKCNLCGKVQDVRSNYCPNCGAVMDGEDDLDLEEPADLEMGYDPYLGCYTDDC